MNEEEKKYYKKREAEYKKWAQEYEKAKKNGCKGFSFKYWSTRH